MNDLEIQALTASRDEWKARALAAEAGVEHREHLLTAMSSADTTEGRFRTGFAVIFDGQHMPHLCVQSNAGDEAEIAARLSEAVGPYLQTCVIALHETAKLRAKRRFKPTKERQ